MKKLICALLALCMTLALVGCKQTPTAPSEETTEPVVTTFSTEESTDPVVDSEPAETQKPTEEDTPTSPEASVDITGWDDVVRLVNLRGDTTTAYLLADGTYMDRTDRVFTYDGGEIWMCGDEEWNRALEEPAFTTELAVERFISQRPDLKTFEDSDQGEKYVFWPMEDMTDFSYQELSMDVTDDGTLVCREQKDLFTIEELTTNDGVVIALCIDGAIPNRGIRYTDGDGMVHRFCLTISGIDGSLLMIPYECE